MKKAVVVIASVLKPVDDTRMYEKLAQSLIRTGKFCVNILGFLSNTHSEHQDIRFYPIFRFPRNHYRRLLANCHFFYYLIKLHPEIIIINTPELAPAVWLYHFFYPSAKIIYDLIENYSLNLTYHHQKHSRLRKFLVRWIDRWEKLLLRISNTVLVAEKGYFQEKACLSSYPTVLLENKVMPETRFQRHGSAKKGEISLLYTGTISPVYGIWDALRLAEQLKTKTEISFRLLGHVPQQETYQSLLKYLEKNKWIQATISLRPIPHKLLLEAMRNADMGIVSHQPLPSIRNCFPTRIWEYMSCELPFFLQDHAPWVTYCQPWDCALPIDFSQPSWDLDAIGEKLSQGKFYSQGVPESIYWDEHVFIGEVECIMSVR